MSAALVAMLALQEHLGVVVLALSAFLVDTALTLAARIVRGEHWWMPHVSHAYQRWVRLTGRHLPVTLAYSIWAAFMVATMFVIRGRGTTFIMGVVVASYLAGTVIWLRLQSISRESAGESRE